MPVRGQWAWRGDAKMRGEGESKWEDGHNGWSLGRSQSPGSDVWGRRSPERQRPRDSTGWQSQGHRGLLKRLGCWSQGTGFALPCTTSPPSPVSWVSRSIPQSSAQATCMSLDMPAEGSRLPQTLPLQPLALEPGRAGVVLHACNPSTRVTEAGRSARAQGQPRLHSQILSQTD